MNSESTTEEILAVILGTSSIRRLRNPPAVQQEVRGTDDLDAVDFGRVSPPHDYDSLGVRVAYGAQRLKHAQELAERYAGTGIWRDKHKELVSFHEVIGTHVNRKTGIRKPTTCGTIHYSKDGCHIVPADPNGRK